MKIERRGFLGLFGAALGAVADGSKALAERAPAPSPAPPLTGIGDGRSTTYALYVCSTATDSPIASAPRPWVQPPIIK